MPNVKQIIDGHNKAILKMAETAQPQKDEGKTCSCRKKEDCPLNGECLVSEVVYQATVTLNRRQKRDIHRSHSYSVQRKIQKPPNDI